MICYFGAIKLLFDIKIMANNCIKGHFEFFILKPWKIPVIIYFFDNFWQFRKILKQTNLFLSLIYAYIQKFIFVRLTIFIYKRNFEYKHYFICSNNIEKFDQWENFNCSKGRKRNKMSETKSSWKFNKKKLYLFANWEISSEEFQVENFLVGMSVFTGNMIV